ncbi:MAG: TIGR04283 family arsenosugar biosynthesis glycosyltransferase [Bdellovibrionales bacterium]|nr:TIGR04283 family arsenosugar biosynthesis glycosyltransferase [Bdellovibrionales bacterium]
MAPQLSIVIPTRNEQDTLPLLIQDLKAQSFDDFEIIVVDAHSHDATTSRASEAGCKVLSSPAGRGKQMNHGVAESQGSYLLFLHADSRIGDPLLLENALANFSETRDRLQTDKIAGHFSLRFDRPRSEYVDCYSFYEAKSHLNRPGTTNGDQGLLISRTYFESLGGFYEDFAFLEDQDFSQRIHESGTLVTLPGTLTTSIRRFEQEGFARRMILSAMIMGLFALRLDDFFQQAPAAYAQHQTQGERLDLPPLCALIHQCLWSKGFRTGFKNWYRIGQYVKENAWQIFFLREYHKAQEEQKWLRFHDIYYEPFTRDPVWYSLATMLTMFWFYGTWLYFRLAQLRTTKKHAIA